MSLEAFALATRLTNGTGDTRDLMHRLQIAALVADTLELRADVATQKLIPGAGMVLGADKATLFPTVLADRSALGGTSDDLVPISEYPVLVSALQTLLGRWPDDLAVNLRALPVSASELHSVAGTGIKSGSQTGRMGPHVTWGSGRQGFLTAGHVAKHVGAAVDELSSGTKLGTVQWANDPAAGPSTSGDLDASLVEFNSAYTATTGSSLVIVAAGQTVSLASTSKSAQVLGFFSHVRLGAARACYSDCYATDTRITSPGDSGGLMEASGNVTGIVVGSFTARDMSIVQSIDYQLRELRARSGFTVSL